MKIHSAATAWVSLFLIAGGLHQVRAQEATQGSVQGSVFSDADGDARKDEGEESSEGQKVKLFKVLEDGTRELVAEVVTDADGNYAFGNLPLGSYVVTFEFSSGVVVETASVINLTTQNPSFVQSPIPSLPQNYRQVYGSLASSPLPGSPGSSGGLDALNLRNPANLTGPEVSRFAP
ncbi:MAG: Cna protein B-type domain-containing protein [Verrucomicrobia bacterium]|nr:MAG: Cna protein B-type domain-containing protein [Verrucomicrobiota bacterium]